MRLHHASGTVESNPLAYALTSSRFVVAAVIRDLHHVVAVAVFGEIAEVIAVLSTVAQTGGFARRNVRRKQRIVNAPLLAIQQHLLGSLLVLLAPRNRLCRRELLRLFRSCHFGDLRHETKTVSLGPAASFRCDAILVDRTVHIAREYTIAARRNGFDKRAQTSP